MSNVTYRRGQVEWALWRAFTLARSSGEGPPPIFRTRIKRLLDLDRDLDVSVFGAKSAYRRRSVTSMAPKSS